MFNKRQTTEDSDAIPAMLFHEYVRQMHVDGDFGFAQLYEDISNATRFYAYTSDVSLVEANRYRNRYSNILTYDHTRVKLNQLPTTDPTAAAPLDTSNPYGYINANYVDVSISFSSEMAMVDRELIYI